MRCSLVLSIVLALSVPGTPLAGDAPAAPSPLARLKSLAGEWVQKGGDGAVAVVYRVTSAGHAVTETDFPGTPYEMLTVYHMDGDDLVLTHYCAEGNFPRMKADAPSNDAIHFKFTGCANLKSDNAGHMHEATITFVDADHVSSAWQYYRDGKAAELEKFDLVRKGKS
ncbi:MAG: hypothetical protein U0166_14445 [Acidobacteriota bacterium]